jgi:hypothetical protein
LNSNRGVAVRLPQLAEQIAERPALLVLLEDVLAVLERPVPVVRLDLRLEERLELEPRIVALAEQVLVEPRFRVRIERRADRHRLILRCLPTLLSLR